MADLLELGEAPHEAEYADLFVFQLYPYASVYLGSEGMLGGEARDRIAGFWRALRLNPPNEPDHLAVLLSFYAGLCEAERAAAPAEAEAWRRARKAFLWEHLWSWLEIYLTRVREVASPFYRRWAETLRGALAEETGWPGPPRLPLHLREATPVSDPRRQGLKPFLQSLLSPVRSGMILVRQDLVRAGRALELGVRVGERRFALEFLLAQDARGMLAWLAAEAARQAAGSGGDDPVSRFWRERARGTARLLQELAGEAE
ncbi:MAG: molecular chaperone [Gemmatimonadota bacterium]